MRIKEKHMAQKKTGPVPVCGLMATHARPRKDGKAADMVRIPRVLCWARDGIVTWPPEISRIEGDAASLPPSAAIRAGDTLEDVFDRLIAPMAELWPLGEVVIPSGQLGVLARPTEELPGHGEVVGYALVPHQRGTAALVIVQSADRNGVPNRPVGVLHEVVSMPYSQALGEYDMGRLPTLGERYGYGSEPSPVDDVGEPAHS